MENANSNIVASKDKLLLAFDILVKTLLIGFVPILIAGSSWQTREAAPMTAMCVAATGFGYLSCKIVDHLLTKQKSTLPPLHFRSIVVGTAAAYSALGLMLNIFPNVRTNYNSDINKTSCGTTLSH